MTTKTKAKAIVSGIVLALTAGLGLHLTAQVKTEVPPPVPGAKPVAMERVKVRGTALEGNLEGNAADRFEQATRR